MSAIPQPTTITSSEVAALSRDSASSTSDTDAAMRLDLSRLRLRSAMMQIANPPPAAPSSLAGKASSVLDSAKSLPGVSAALDMLEGWWSGTPLRDAAYFTNEASRSLLVPIAQRSPLKLVFGALLFGAVLVLLKPWRWLLRASLLAGLVPTLMKLAVKQLPLGTMLRLFVRHKLDKAPSRRQQADVVRSTRMTLRPPGQ